LQTLAWRGLKSLAAAGLLLALTGCGTGSAGKPTAGGTTASAAMNMTGSAAAGSNAAPTAAASSASPAATTLPGPAPLLDGPRHGTTVDITLTAEPATIAIADGVTYHAWTFDGHVPGPVIRVRQGDTVHFTLVNKDTMGHSIDFHAAQVPWDKDYQPVAPGQSETFDWVAAQPGVFMYHCGTGPMIQHIANGMYGAIIVDPATPRPAAQEYVLVQGEWYAAPDDTADMMANNPKYVVFNGYADKYKEQPLTARPGQLIRLYVVDAGPNRWSSFHVVGTLFSTVEASGNPANQLHGVQSYSIGPGDAAMFELTIPQAGTYPFVDHSMADMMMGAVGLIKVSPDAQGGPLAP
jgi:nitrite reductase (NO-forming)